MQLNVVHVWIVLALCAGCASRPTADVPRVETLPSTSPPPTLRPLPPPGTRLSPPRLSVTALGPALIRIVADTDPTEQVYGVRIERTPETGMFVAAMITTGFGYTGSHGSTTQDATPDTTYRYRATAQSGMSRVLDSFASAEVTVRTPSAPTGPPAAPARLEARPVSPFAIELTWEDRSDNEYGFEVSQRTDTGDFRPIARVDLDTPRFVHHGLAVATEASYRVRAFNPRGISAPTELATARTLAVEERPVPLGEVPSAPADCTTLEAARVLRNDDGAPVIAEWEEIDLGRGRTADLLTDRETCGTGGCGADLYATYDGCYRQLGDFFGFGVTPFGTSPSGWPLLTATAHCSAGHYSVFIYQLLDGRYVPIDRYMGCSYEDELTEARPPFRAFCYEDEPCQQDCFSPEN